MICYLMYLFLKDIRLKLCMYHIVGNPMSYKTGSLDWIVKSDFMTYMGSLYTNN